MTISVGSKRYDARIVGDAVIVVQFVCTGVLSTHTTWERVGREPQEMQVSGSDDPWSRTKTEAVSRLRSECERAVRADTEALAIARESLRKVTQYARRP